MKTTLVVLAAGLGSRYGGFKQLDAIGPNAHSIMDYSLFDALNVGFTSIVLVVQESMIVTLTERYITKRHWPITFAIQNADITIDDIKYSRQKPWGTAHALWCAKDVVNTPFVLINADDFYGRESFRLAYNYLQKDLGTCAVLFPIEKTLSRNGTVNRAEATIENGWLQTTVEREKIRMEDDTIVYSTAKGEKKELAIHTLVSMNMWGLTPDIFNFIDSDISGFIELWKQNTNLEYQLPSVIDAMIQHRLMEVKAIATQAHWVGVTYKTDKDMVKNQLQQLHDSGIYDNL
ncbi:MAG: hypothetical protein KBT58_04200 [Bizionia sp.]|nr:hypothetical protein [Bizionia sp.]